MITVISPTEIKLDDSYWDKLDDLKEFLTFTSKTALFELERFKKNTYFYDKLGPERYTEQLNELKASIKVCLLKQNKDGLFTHSGLLNKLQAKYGDLNVVSEVVYPEPKGIAWLNAPKYDLRYYQREALEALIKAKHASIEVATGAGKTAVILYLAKHFGLKTLIMVPSIQIAQQMLSLFEHSLGKKWVGLLGNGKKNSKHLITIAVAKSLTNLKSSSPLWEDFKDLQVLIADESHCLPAESLTSACFGIAKNAPYRFFFSATQMRNDGADLLLDGITGPVVYEYSLEKAINEGYLAKPEFLIFKSESKSSAYYKDALKMTAKHFYQNAELHKQAALFACAFYNKTQRPVLIMMDHVQQFKLIYGHLNVPFEFVHGGVSKEIKKYIPEKYHKPKVLDLVERFNKNEIPILCGTSCVSTGTDFQPVGCIINLMAGKSEIKFKQLIGRGTRRVPGKDSFLFVDYIVDNVPMLYQQAKTRIDIYRSVWNDIKFI